MVWRPQCVTSRIETWSKKSRVYQMVSALCNCLFSKSLSVSNNAPATIDLLARIVPTALEVELSFSAVTLHRRPLIHDHQPPL